VKWRSAKNDAANGGYSHNSLQCIFEKVRVINSFVYIWYMWFKYVYFFIFVEVNCKQRSCIIFFSQCKSKICTTVASMYLY